MAERRYLLLILSFVGFIALGLPDAVIGVAWPTIRDDFDVPLDALGPFFVTATIGAVISSTFSGPVIERLGIGRLLAGSCLLTATAMFGYTVSPAWAVMVTLGLLSGLGAGAIDSAINMHAATQYSARVVNVLHAFYAVGAAGGPAIMTAMLASGHGWRSGYWIIVVIEVLLAIAFVVTRKRWPASGHGHEHRPARLLQTLRLGKVQLSMAVFLIYTGCEVAAGAWFFSLLYESRGFATAAAGTAVTLYWVGLFGSRLGYAFLPANARPTVVIGVCIVAALVCMGVLVLNLHPLIDTVAVTLIGFASGPIFPSMIATTPARVGPQHTANTIGLQVSMGATGLALLPALSGLAAQNFGLESVPKFLGLCWAILLLAYLSLEGRGAGGMRSAASAA